MQSKVNLALAALAILASSPAVACVGDCDGDVAVEVQEQTSALRVALGLVESSTCDSADNDRDRAVTVEEMVLAVARKIDGCGGGLADVLLYGPQGNQLDVYDLATGRVNTLVPETREHVNGQTCLVPGTDGYFLAGTDTEQPVLRAGWGIYSPDGTFLQKIPLPPYEGDPGDPFGCTFDAQGRLFTTAIRRQGGLDGQLFVYFPPDYRESCILDETLRTPGTMAADGEGNVYVAESLPPGKVQRFAPPFPANAAECATTPLNKEAFIEYGDLVASLGIARGPNGHWYVSQVVGLGIAGPTIREHMADGTYIRDLIPMLPKGRGGNPTGLAVAEDGTVYYADLGLDMGVPPDTVPGKGTVRKITFDGDGNPRFPELIASGLNFPDAVSLLPARFAEATTLGGNLRRTYFYPQETQITRDSAAELIVKWRYLTNAIVTASPAVALVDLPQEGATKLVITPSWDANVYALRADNGSRVWSYTMKQQPGASFPYASSATVARVDGRQMVFVGGGMTMYALDARTGQLLWSFDAGTGCDDCGVDAGDRREKNEVESTPVVHNGLVYFGMDIDDSGAFKGGLYAVSARDGRLVWYFDLETSTACRPFASDEILRFDGYHSAADLGLPDDFFATRPGCNFDRTGHTCGNVVSSFALDARRGLLYTTSANCDTDDDSGTPEAPPPMPPYDEAVFAITLDGNPVWRWRPREIDNDDLAFIGVPNLFEIQFDGQTREVVGVGNKDGRYYVLDRDGVNEVSGVIEPYWSTPTVPGGPIGGIIASAAVGDGGIYFGTGIGFDLDMPQKPSMWALRADDGGLLWNDPDKFPSFGSAAGVPGVVFEGETASPLLWAFDSANGDVLVKVNTLGLPGGLASAPAISDGALYVGAGTGARGGRPAEMGFIASETDSPISAFCLSGTPGCPSGPRCNDDDTCTYDFRADDGDCMTEPAPDGIRCVMGVEIGACVAGSCVIVE